MIFKPTYGKLGHVWQGFEIIAGLKRINYGYGGALFRVRRGSDNAEKDFFSTEGVAAWVGAGNDGFVTKLYDQSGKGNDWTNDTTAEQPKIVEDGSLTTKDSKPAMKFSGGQALFCPKFTYTNDKLYVSVVSSVNQTNQTNAIVAHFDSGADQRSWLLQYRNDGRIRGFASGNGVSLHNVAYNSYTTSMNVIEGLFEMNLAQSNDRIKLFYNNVSNFNTLFAGFQFTPLFAGDCCLSLGSSLNNGAVDAPLNGTISEVMIKIDDNKAGNRAAIFNDINNRWGIV